MLHSIATSVTPSFVAIQLENEAVFAWYSLQSVVASSAIKFYMVRKIHVTNSYGYFDQ